MSNDSIAPGIRVFVYGTLKRNRSNHYLIAGDPGNRYLGMCYIEGNMAMLSLGAFPGVVYAPDQIPAKHKIFGEVFNINEETLQALDRLEGNGSFYNREKVTTPWKNAWCYFAPPSMLTTPSRPVLTPACWRPTTEEKEYFKDHMGEPPTALRPSLANWNWAKVNQAA